MQCQRNVRTTVDILELTNKYALVPMNWMSLLLRFQNRRHTQMPHVLFTSDQIVKTRKLTT